MRDVYLQPDAPDPVLDEATVLRLVRRHVPRARALRDVDESGGEARAYMVDDDLVLKTQRPHRLRPRTSIEKESHFLDALASHPYIRVPRNLGYGREGPIEYIVLTRVPGVALRNYRGDERARRATLEALGRTLRAIHGIDQAFAQGELFPGDRTAGDLRARFATILEQFRASPRKTESWPVELDLDRIAERLLAATPADTMPVALHSNPGPVHTFVDADSGTFTGLIDFGDAYRSHPALDLGQWQDDDAVAVRAGYAASGPLPSTFDTVAKIWQVVRQLNNVLRGYQRPDVTVDRVRMLIGRLD